MSLLNKLIKELKDINILCDSVYTSEKSQIQYIKTESKKLFDNVYKIYNNLIITTNTTSIEYYEHTELIVLLAETSYNTENYLITRKILDNFLQKYYQKDQYYCRAKLLLGLIIVNEATKNYGSECIKYRKIALKSMIEALEVANNNENIHRYSFIIYNATILCWKVIQPFLRTGRAKYFTSEMQKLSNSLELISDSDKDWRIIILCATSYTLYDDNQNKLASDLLDKACEHAEKMLKIVQEKEILINTNRSNCTKEIENLISIIRNVEEHTNNVNKRNRIIKQLEELETGGKY